MSTQTIAVHLPDGAVREVPAGTTSLEIANSISPRLAAAAVAARLTPVTGTIKVNPAPDGQPAEAAMYAAEDAAAPRLVDLAKPLTADTRLELIKETDPEALKVLRHSAAHVLATAVLELFPETKLGHGPATDAGFFYDFYREKPFTPEDLVAIEAKMAEVVARDEPFLHEFEPREQALAEFQRDGDFMKTHFVTKFTQPGEEVSFYRNGTFVDFCRGPHVPSTGRVKAVKVTSLAGAYWLGDEKNPQLQRIYGTAFFSKKELDAHFARLEEAAKRDHRLLGKQLDLFSIQELAGAGLIFWHPKGGIVRKVMEDWMREECLRRGYSLVFTPHVMRRELWKISGHEGFYAGNMYTPMELDDAEYRLKPMNCPGHILIYKNSPKSYRDLPVRLAELGNVYRYERSGTMHGLLRVRGFTQDDAHIFCTPGQIEDEVVACIDFAEAVLKTFGFAEFQVELSTWDPNDRAHYAGSDENWNLAVGSLQRALGRKGIRYKTISGEAAFYGPKIDVKLVDVLGRLWQLSTVQFDFNLPARFELEYVGEDGERHQPVMVHRALFGSVERFFGVLIEHYAGAFPLWLAPVQAGLVPISERHHAYAKNVEAELKAAGLRVEIDDRNEKMNGKIRDFANQKTPYILVFGDKEEAAGSVSVRTRGKGDQGSMPLAEFIAKAKALVESQSTELTVREVSMPVPHSRTRWAETQAEELLSVPFIWEFVLRSPQMIDGTQKEVADFLILYKGSGLLVSQKAQEDPLSRDEQKNELWVLKAAKNGLSQLLGALRLPKKAIWCEHPRRGRIDFPAGLPPVSHGIVALETFRPVDLQPAAADLPLEKGGVPVTYISVNDFLNVAMQLRTVPELLRYLDARRDLPEAALRRVGDEQPIFEYYLLNETLRHCGGHRNASEVVEAASDQVDEILGRMVEYRHFSSLMEHVGHELATRSATCLDGLPPELLTKFDEPEMRQNYLLMQEVIADLPLRDRAALGKQFATVIDRLSGRSQGYAQATARVDSRPEWVFVFGASKGWAREGMLRSVEPTMRAALAHYGKQRCMIIIDRDGESYEVAMTRPGQSFTPTSADVLNGNKLFAGLRVTSIELEGF